MPARLPALDRARLRRIAGGLALVALVAMASVQSAGASSNDPHFKKLHHQLKQTKERMHHRREKLRALQKDMDKLAQKIFETLDKIEQNRIQMGKLAAKLPALHQQLVTLQAHLDSRSREAYIMGPGAPMLYLLTATSAAEAANRISLLDEMNRRDAVLAQKVEDTKLMLQQAREAIARAQTATRILMLSLAADRRALAAKMAESRRILAALDAKRNEILYQISRVHPFATCPIHGPHALTDTFGIWVNRPKKWGGDHVHQGDDIMSPMGTPIVAPFPGRAVVATNHIGGMAVKVYGQFGYVYNAHLSRMGQLGDVKTGTVVGYVGATGDTSVPHDHFEWHPNNGAAVDPYPGLTQVC